MSDASEVHLAHTTYPINELLTRRWSPYSFADKPVSDDDLRALFEAARWAPSCFNEQPWYYIVATRDEAEEFDKLLYCLVEGNLAWAAHVPVLMLGVASVTFARNGKSNRHAYHDLGQATAHLTIEATARGLCVHQMAGLNPSRARQLYGIPDQFEVVTAIAVGYAGDNAALAEDLKKRDSAPRRRKELSELVFGGGWGASHTLLKG